MYMYNMYISIYIYIYIYTYSCYIRSYIRVIFMYLTQSDLLNKRSELVSKCRHENKFLLQKFNRNY